jgi:hypothetical protein
MRPITQQGGLNQRFIQSRARVAKSLDGTAEIQKPSRGGNFQRVFPTLDGIQ